MVSDNFKVDEWRNRLAAGGQAHVLRFWDSLSEAGREQLAGQLQDIDWEDLPRWIDDFVKHVPDTALPEGLKPAPYRPALPTDFAQEALYQEAADHGRELLRNGCVAGFTVAGGQGTRLGYDGPKGTFPISPVREKSLFQLFAEGILRAQEKYSVVIPWYIMTSPLNDPQTRDYFEEHVYFGLNPADVMFFKQGVMPAIGLDGRLLMAAADSLALSPNGHGGSLLAMRESGALADMAKRGIDFISYWQVDNPLVYQFDPLFIGLHSRQGSEMSCRGLAKNDPLEKLGNFCLVDDQVTVIEYSDMPDDLARRTTSDGQLHFRMGSPAIHIISRAFVERMTEGGKLRLPFHRAEKKVPFIDDSGRPVAPAEPNAVKLETFIFDALPQAANVLILEAVREEQFGPVKNATGIDSVESCRRLLQERAASWLERAGVEVPRNDKNEPACTLELSPKTFLDPEDVVQKIDLIQPPQPGKTEYYE